MQYVPPSYELTENLILGIRSVPTLPGQRLKRGVSLETRRGVVG